MIDIETIKEIRERWPDAKIRGKILRNLRKHLGMNGKQLAVLAGVSYAAIYQFERGAEFSAEFEAKVSSALLAELAHRKLEDSLLAPERSALQVFGGLVPLKALAAPEHFADFTLDKAGALQDRAKRLLDEASGVSDSQRVWELTQLAGECLREATGLIRQAQSLLSPKHKAASSNSEGGRQE